MLKSTDIKTADAIMHSINIINNLDRRSISISGVGDRSWQKLMIPDVERISGVNFETEVSALLSHIKIQLIEKLKELGVEYVEPTPCIMYTPMLADNRPPF